MVAISDAEKLKIKNDILEKLNESFKVNNVSSRTPFYKAILHIMDKFNEGDFYGTISIRINGPEIKFIHHEDVSIRLDSEYGY